jgi:signal transduction histidine kinase
MRMKKIVLLLIWCVGALFTTATAQSNTNDEQLVSRTKPIEKEINDLLDDIRSSKKKKSYEEVARCYQKIGRLFQEHALYGFAIASYMESLDYEDMSHANHYVTYRRIATCLFDVADYDASMSYLRRARKLTAGNYERDVEVTSLQVMTACAQHDKEASEKYMKHLEKLYKNMTYKSNVIISTYHVARFYYLGFTQNKWKEALEERAMATTGNIPLRKDLELAYAYTALKDTVNAIKYYTQFEQRLAKLRKINLTPLFEQYTNILDYRKVDLENEAIENEAHKLNLLQVQEKQHLAELERLNMEMQIQQEGDSALLNRSELLLQNRILHQQRLENRQKHRLRKQKERANELSSEVNSMILSYGIILVVLILLIIGGYILFEVIHSLKIKKERDKAIHAEQMKSLFFQNMNHEIRTPLNAIAGFNELLHGEMAECLSDEEKTQMTELIESNANMLVTLVNDVLDISNFESGSYKLHYSWVNIHKLCFHVMESVKSRVAKEVQTHYEPDPNDQFLLYTDEERLTQVLTNFMTNACKYTEKGHITLGYMILEETVLFSVTDTGRGIPKGEEEAVFQRFHMVANSKKGIGMGLHICNMIAQLMHGAVFVDTEYKGGARFCFEHPIHVKQEKKLCSRSRFVILYHRIKRMILKKK